MRLGTTTLMGVAPTAAPQGNRSDIMTSYLFDKIPDGLLGGSRLQELEARARCSGLASCTTWGKATRSSPIREWGDCGEGL